MKDSLENAIKQFPEIPLIDLHFYAIKGYGINDPEIKKGKPKFHIIGDRNAFSFVPVISSQNSPYKFEGKELKYRGQVLPFRTKFISRLNSHPTYFYLRGIQEWMLTLDSETILSLNFQPICGGCEWCCREVSRDMRNVSPREGMEILRKGRINFQEIDKITFVTGMYREDDEVVRNILEFMKIVKEEEGYRGRVLYIGSQIKTADQIQRLLNGLGNTPFKYAYTLETFTNRERMHTKKSLPIEEAVAQIDRIKSSGVRDLEYSYMPGLDAFKDFLLWMPRLATIARPHLSIFRPVKSNQEEIKDEEFRNDSVGYLCKMRLEFEKAYEGPIYQNNLASLWGFPIERINPLFLTDKTSLA